MQRSEHLQRGWLPMLLVALGVGAAAGTTVPRTVQRASEGEVRRSTAESERREAQNLGGGDFTSDGLRPILTILAEALGVSLESEREQTSRAARLLLDAIDGTAWRDGARGKAVLTRVINASDYVQEGAELASIRDMIDDELLSRLPLELKDVGELAEARRSLVDRLRRRAFDGRLLERLRERAKAGGINVSFVIATIADYVDSNTGWYVDQQLEALQMAMGSAGYVLDRFHLVEWSRDGQPPPPGMSHREEPGAIVFRSTARDKIALRVALLVPETPTSGVHREALHAALSLVDRWHQGENPRPPIGVLGPTFSGSAMSLRRTLDDHQASFRCQHHARVITGSANAVNNREVIAPKTGKDTFDSTTHPFPELLSALKKYIERVNPAWATGSQMAVLHEGNTTFGRSFLTGTHSDPTSKGPPTVPGKGKVDPAALRAVFPNVRTVAFPMHISRLRDAVAETLQGQVRQPFGLRTPVPLSVRDKRLPTDQLPPLTPDLTAASVQTTVTAMFEAVRRERFRLVGIIATDDRDAMYLARELRRAAPDAQLVFFGNHMLYLHPEYASYTRGALVVSSYPLAGAIGNWVGAPTAEVRQFQSSTSQGLFNAALALTGNEELLVDYSVPGSPGGSGPGVWVSAIGRTGFVPLAWFPPQLESYLYKSTPRDAESAPAGATTSPSEPGPGLSVGIPLTVLFFLVLAILFWHVWAVGRQIAEFLYQQFRKVMARWRATLRARRRADREPQILSEQALGELVKERWRRQLQSQRVRSFQRVFVLPWTPRDVRRASQALIHAAFAVLGFVGVWAVALALASHGYRPGWWLLPGGLLFAAVPLALSVTERSGARKDDGLHVQGFAFATVLAILSLVFFGFTYATLWFVDAGAAEDPIAWAMFAERALALGSLVSPSVPMLLFALIAYWWFVWQLRSLTLVGKGYTALFARSTLLTQARTGEAVARAAAAGAASPNALIGAAAAPASPPRGSMTALLLGGDFIGASGGRTSSFDNLRSRFTRVVDATLPTRHRRSPLMVTLVVTAVLAPLVYNRVHTLEGGAFTWTFRFGTLAGMALGTLALSQTWVLWRQVHAALTRLGRSPFASASAFARVRSFNLDWRLNLGLPRRDELSCLMAAADSLEELLDRPFQKVDVPTSSERALRERAAREILTSCGLTPDRTSLREALERDRQSDFVRLLACDAFHHVWDRVERYLPALQLWFAVQRRIPDRLSDTGQTGHSQTSTDWWVTDWLERAAEVVALTQAFVIRDLLSRVVAGLSVACVSFVLLLAAHLLYSFPGRATMLTIDWIAVGAAGTLAVYILVQMERSVVLSHLWNSAPGRVTFNRDFVHRVAFYGALPVLTLISALFPELGDTLFGWLAPARQLAGF